MNRFLQFVICIMIASILTVSGCNSRTGKKSVSTIKKTIQRRQPDFKESKRIYSNNKENAEFGKTIEPINTLTVNNSATDQDNFILEWDAEQIKGINGHFNIYRRYGEGEYKHIAQTAMYDGNHPNLSKFTWKERDRESGIYMHPDYQSEPRLPLRRYIFRIRFQPLNESKYHISDASNEVEAYFVPQNANAAMHDIVETLQNAYEDECGFFASFPIENKEINHSGYYSGFFKREINLDNQVVYTFDEYSNFGSLYITGQLKGNLKRYKDNTNINKAQPLEVSGNLDIDGIYKAEIKVDNLMFSNECGTSLTNGAVHIKYKHPIHGYMQSGFKGMTIPQKFLTYAEDFQE